MSSGPDWPNTRPDTGDRNTVTDGSTSSRGSAHAAPTASTLEGWLRRSQRKHRRHSHRERAQHRRGESAAPSRAHAIGELFAGGPDFAATAPYGAIPSLHMPEPESARDAWISGGLSAAVHLAILLFFALSAWLAPEIVNDIIPVKILKEAPPSDAEPAPAPAVPRALAPRPSVKATATVAPRAIPRAPVAQPTAVTAVVPTETVQMARVDPARAPSQVVQQQIRSDVVRAVRSPTANSASPIAIAPTAPVAIQPSSVSVIDPGVSGPVAIAPTKRVAVGAPQAFSSLGEANASDYAPSTDLPTQAIAGSQPTSEFGVSAEFAIETVDRSASGGGTGGTGVSQGTARCLESTYTYRYLEQEMKPRVLTRWLQYQLADDVAPGATVVLNFTLDASGSATSIEVRSADSEALGSSCVRAMRDASPFPPLGGDLRCLAGKKLKATFKVPR